jgi:hypothetical protein
MNETPSKPSSYGTKPGRANSFRHWRGGLIALASLVTLTAVGCKSTASSSPAVNGSSQGSGGTAAVSGLASPAAFNGAVAGSRSARSHGTITWSSQATQPEKAGTGAVSGVAGGALFGGSEPLTSVTSKLGRKLAIVRVYFQIGERFSSHAYSHLLAGGSTLLVSLDTLPGRGPSYASIAAGKDDATIKSFLENVNQAAVTNHLGAIYFCFEHEADLPGKQALGSPAEFIKAWDHIHQLAVAAHLNWQQGGRLHWVMILLREAYVPASQQPHWARNEGLASQYWPGNNEADIVAADGYNSGNCRNVHIRDYRATGTQVVSPEALFGPVISFAQTHGNAPVFIAEWGTVPYSVPSVVPNYIHQMGQFVTANPEVAAASYWDAVGSDSCDYYLNNQPAALAALAAVGHSAGLQGHA